MEYMLADLVESTLLCLWLICLGVVKDTLSESGNGSTSIESSFYV